MMRIALLVLFLILAPAPGLADPTCSCPCECDAPSLDAPGAIPPDAFVVDMATPWDVETLVAWIDCKGADGVNVNVTGGVIRVATACEQGAKVIIATDDGAPPWAVQSFGGIQGAEDAILCDGDGDGVLDLFAAAPGRILWWRDTGLGYFDLPVFVSSQPQYFNRVVCVSPGVILTGSYSTGASVDRYTYSGGVWGREALRAAEWVKNIVPYGADWLIWDRTGPNRGVRSLFGGQRFTIAAEDAYTEWGDVVDGRITTGTNNPISGATTMQIIGEGAIAWPSNAGKYHYAALVDVDHTGPLDLVITMSHSPGPESSILWLKAPSWERGEISGPTGEKHDNWTMLGNWLYYTEEKTGGLQRRRNPHP